MSVVPGRVRAAEVWTPETGQFDIESDPRETPDQKRAYALALLGVGQWREGRRILHEQMKTAPDAGWVPHARLAIGRALLNAGQGRLAFDELAAIDAATGDEAMVARAREMQFEAAHVTVKVDSLRRALELLDRMEAYAETDEDRAFILKEKADVTMEDRRYLESMNRYLETIDEFPRSTWVPYCEYGLAVAEWRFASWLMLGLQDLADAEQSFRDFIMAYPTHPLAPQARATLVDVRSTRAAAYRRVVEFYIERENRPWAAAPYLAEMIDLFGDLPAGAWAELKLRQTRDSLPKPLPGSTRPLQFGLVSTAQEVDE